MKNDETKPTPHWQVVENVVAALERVRGNVPGMLITQKAQVPVYHDPSRVRDVDVLVRYPLGTRTFSLGVEVKAHTRPLIVGDIGQILDIWRDVRLDRFAVVSLSGFSEDAIAKAEREKLELVRLEEFERSDFWQHDPKLRVAHRECVPVSVEYSYQAADIDHDLVAPLRAFLAKGFAPSEASLSNASGATPLADFIARCGGEALQKETALSTLVDNDFFDLHIDMSAYRETSTVIQTSGQTFPVPRMIVARFQLHETIEWVPERRFRIGVTEILTSELSVNNDLAQTTIVLEPQPDGTRKIIGITLGSSQPKDIKVDREP